jgi:hypothetical protein
MTDLWHYCCEHSARGIVKDGFLRPGTDGLVWVTDLHPPRREALGLTMLTIHCDRTTNAFMVADDTDVVWWPYARTSLADVKGNGWVEGLENAEGAEPRHWFVSVRQIPVMSV